ncbi:MAG: hypothetical protein EBV45_12885, partial [Chloroflexi bacterium]|nr:hypothetical protein [Chloroflexota bacterium]
MTPTTMPSPNSAIQGSERCDAPPDGSSQSGKRSLSSTITLPSTTHAICDCRTPSSSADVPALTSSVHADDEPLTRRYWTSSIELPASRIRRSKVTPEMRSGCERSATVRPVSSRVMWGVHEQLLMADGANGGPSPQECRSSSFPVWRSTTLNDGCHPELGSGAVTIRSSVMTRTCASVCSTKRDPVGPACNGMKTGYTQAAGFCLVSSASSGRRDVISVVLGDA